MATEDIVFCLVFALILFIVFFASLIYYSKFDKGNKKEEKHELNPDIAKLMLDEKLLDKINSYIDNLISEAAGIYQIMVLSVNPNQYINTEEQIKMEKYVYYSAFKNINQPRSIELLKLVYKIENNDDLKSIIDIRVKIYMINFIKDYNKDIE